MSTQITRYSEISSCDHLSSANTKSFPVKYIVSDFLSNATTTTFRANSLKFFCFFFNLKQMTLEKIMKQNQHNKELKPHIPKLYKGRKFSMRIIGVGSKLTFHKKKAGKYLKKKMTQHGLSCRKQPLPISDHSGVIFWVVAYRKFDCKCFHSVNLLRRALVLL